MPDVRPHECWTRAWLAAYQLEAGRHQRTYAYSHSPVYQRAPAAILLSSVTATGNANRLTRSILMRWWDGRVTQ